MNSLDEKVAHERSSLRQSMLAEEPVYLRVNLDGGIILPVVELGGGGARLLCSKYKEHFEDWFVGHSLGPSRLMLPENEMHEVNPVIRWIKWPVAGVQFMDLPDKDRREIFRFLFKLERIKTKRMTL